MFKRPLLMKILRQIKINNPKAKTQKKLVSLNEIVPQKKLKHFKTKKVKK